MTHEFGGDVRFLLRDDLVVEAVDDEFLILDLRHNTYFGLNGVGRVIWQSIRAGETFDQIVAGICDVYDVEPGEARADACAFISEIVDKRLATVAA
jgi:hypothetical protein